MADHDSERSGEFRMNVDVPRTGTAVVTVGGDVDLYSAPSLRERLTDLVDAGADRVVVDLSSATFLDSMALGILVGVRRRLTETSGSLELIVPDPTIRRIFEISTLDRVFELHDSRDAAELRG